MIRIRVEKTKYGHYEAHLQLYVGGWFDEPLGRIGKGNSIGSAIADLRKEMEFEISSIRSRIEESYGCDVVDNDGNRVSYGLNITLAELLGI